MTTMSSAARKTPRKKNTYPTSDGRPMAETDWHRELMNALIRTLRHFFLTRPNVYVSGNLLIFYIPGDRLRHLSPDVFVVKGAPNHDRPNYLVWKEGKAPDIVIELTSSSTRDEDVKDKFMLYQDVLKVREYFLFDPLADYLKPPLQGYRLQRGKYRPISFVAGRLPSKVLGLHLEAHGRELHLHNPRTEMWLLTPDERAALAEERASQMEGENETLRRQVEELRRRLGEG